MSEFTICIKYRNSGHFVQGCFGDIFLGIFTLR